MTDYEFDPSAGVYRLRRWRVTRPAGFPWWLAVAVVVGQALMLAWQMR